MNSIKDHLTSLLQELPKGCALVAVSKTKPASDIQVAYDSGHRDFGENKVQELVSKEEELPKDIKWHMIGHLQRNKVKYIAPFVHLIHGVDTVKLLKEIDKQGRKNERVIDCLLQVHIAKEETKFGFSESEIETFLGSEEAAELTHVRVVGLMGMATNTDNEEMVAAEFRELKTLFNKIKNDMHAANLQLEVLSMGMSGDYKIAIAEGSNMVRIGSSIFGSRH